MEKWKGKICVVTGASVGIGASVALALADAGMIVVGFARRVAEIEELSKKVSGSGKIFAKKCDVTKENEVLEAFNYVKELGGVDVLINNAGIIRASFLIEAKSEDFTDTFQTNVLGACICIREAVKSMRERNVYGHVIILNSILGHRIPDVPVPLFCVYPASKYALTAISQSVRQELSFHKTNIKITSISPGMVKTDFLDVFKSNLHEAYPKLKAEDVTSAILYSLATPEHVQIDEITLTAMFPHESN